MTMTVFTSIKGVMVIVKVGHESHAMMRFPPGMECVHFCEMRRLEETRIYEMAFAAACYPADSLHSPKGNLFLSLQQRTGDEGLKDERRKRSNAQLRPVLRHKRK